MWVIEGSVLGGVVIDRALQSLFGDQREGRRYFEPPLHMSQRWQQVCSAVEIYGQDESAADAIADGAVAAFQCVEYNLLGVSR